MAKFKGTGAGETYSGTSGKDKIDGKGGDDFLEGLGGDDDIKGGDGNDTLIGGDGDDKLDGGKGDDEISGGLGDDKIKGGDGNDVITDTGGDDDVDAGDGDNTVQLSGGDNKVKAKDGDDLIETGDGDDKIDAGDGDNIVRASGGDNDIKTKHGDDLVETGAGSDKIDVGKGDDTVRSGDGADEIKAKDGDDLIEAGAGDDLVKAGAGSDTVFGGDGRDSIFGDGSGSGGSGSGSGATFNDYLDGGAGDDWVVGGQGEDTVLGGAGNDILFGDAGGSGKKWYSGSGSGSGLYGGSGSGSGSFAGSGSGSGGFNDYLDGGAGDDLVFAGGGNDEAVYTMAENGGASDDYRGGDGIDTLTLNFTTLEWLDPAVQADVAAYLQFLANHINPATGQADSTPFQFTAFDLSAREFENLRVFVDGVELDPADDPVNAVDDAATLNEDDAATGFPSVLVNDSVPDLVKSVTLVSGPSEGTLVFNEGVLGAPDGSFSIDPAGDFDDLAVGESRDVSFVYEVTDANDDTDQATVTITVTGTNDAPDITVEAGDSDAATIAETDAGLTAAGTLTLMDVDTTDLVGVAVTSVSALGNTTDPAAPGNAALLAMLTAAPAAVLDGTETTDGFGWSFDSGAEAFDYLAVGESIVLAYEITATDDNGATDTQTVTITVTGTNDAPDITVEAGDSDAATLAETDAGLTASGTLTLSDVDTTDLVGVAVTGVSATGNTGDPAAPDSAALLAMLSVAPAAVLDGSETADTFTWAFDSGSEAFDYLAVDESLVVTYEITASDDSGAANDSATQLVTITIEGTNDGPVAVADGNAGDAVVESGVAPVNVPFAGDATASGNVLTNDTDVDTSDVLSVAEVNGAAADVGASVTGTYGSVVIDSNGNYTYTLNNSDPDTEALAQGASAQDVFTYTVSDGEGGTDTATLTIDITGTNDAPEFFSTPPAPIVEDFEGGATGWSNTATRADTPAFTEFLGNFGGGESSSKTFALSGTQTTVTLAFDVYEFSTWDAENFVVKADGVEIINDFFRTDGFTPDDGSTKPYAISVTNTAPSLPGTLSYNTEVWHYEITINTSATNLTLEFGSTLNQSASDESWGLDNLVITEVDGSGPVEGSVTELADNAAGENSATLSVDGTIAFTDVDLTDTHTVSATANGAGYLGNMVVSVSDDTTGDGTGEVTWTFSVDDSAVDYLAAGEILTQSYDIAVDDGEGGIDTHTVTITLTGTNDAPEIDSAVQTGSITETADAAPGVDSDPVDATGTITFDDVDLADSPTASVVYQYIPGGPAGGTAVLTGAQSSVLFDNFSLGLVTDNPDGSGSVDWTYSVPNAEIDFLAEGETVVLISTVEINDQKGGTDTQDVTITITGTNDGPLATADTNAGDAVVESGVTPGNTPFAGDDSATGNVLTNDSDVDTSDNLSVSAIAGGTVGAAVQGTYGSVVIDSDGSWTYTLDNTDPDTEALAQGAAAQDVFTYTVSDGNGGTDTATLTIDITGTNDAPVVTAIDAGSVSEDDPAVTIDLLAGQTDVDSTSLSATNISVTDDLGAAVIFTDNSNGTISIDPSQYDALDTGEDRTLTVSYDVSDGSASIANTATLVVEGETDNLPPVANDDALGGNGSHSGNVAVFGASDGTSTSSGSGNVANDLSALNYFDSVTVLDGTESLSDLEQFDSVLVYANSYSQQAAYGDLLADYVDGGGGLVVATFAYQDQPSGSDWGELETGGYLPFENYLGNYETQSLGTYDATSPIFDGPFVVDQLTGYYRDEVNLTSDATLIASWGDGTPLVAIDSSGVIGVTLFPNDYYSSSLSGDYMELFANALAYGEISPLTDENTAHTIVAADLLDNDTDPDGDTLVISAVSGTSALGATVTLNGDGSVTYDPTTSTTLDEMAEGETLEDTFTYTVSDGNGGTDTATVTLTVSGVDDPPIVTNVVTAQSGFTDEAFSYTLPADLFTDHDEGGAVTYDVTLDDGSPLPSWLTFDPVTQELSYAADAPQPSDVGLYNLRVTATEEDGQKNSTTLTLTVLDGSLIEGTSIGETLTGTIQGDLIRGLGGNDFLYGLSGADVLDGGTGNDQLYGEAGDDVLIGGDGNDFIRPGDGTNTVDAGAGDDRVYLEFDQGTVDTISLGDGNDEVYTVGYLSSDVVDAGAGDDRIQLRLSGSSSNPAEVTLTLGAGADVVDLSYSYGNDFAFATITDFNPNEDTIDLDTYLNNIITGWDGSSNPFGAGFMRLVQDGSDTVLEVDRNGGGDNYERMIVFEGKTVAQFTAANFEPPYPPDGSVPAGITLNGTAAGETLEGTIGTDTLNGLGGNDNLFGNAAGDTLDGGTGNDQLYGEAGDDVLIGGDGNDFIRPGDGTNTVDAGAGDDRVYLEFDQGTVDTISLGDGNDEVYTVGYLSSDVVDAGAGDDRIQLRLSGSSSNPAEVTLTLGAGADVVDLSYSYGNDFAFATITDFNPNEDTIDLDTYLNNIITGWDGSSNPFGAGFMRLVQDGSDTVLEVDRNGGGDNYERMIVFEGKTVAQFTAANFEPPYPPDGSVPAGITLNGTAAGETLEGTIGTDTLNGLGGNDNLFGNAAGDTLDGGTGNDQLYGEAGDDVLIGGDGNDFIRPGDGTNTVDAGAGDDRVYLEFDQGTVDTISLGDGNDEVYTVGYLSSDVVDAGAGDDRIQLRLSGSSSNPAEVTLTLGAGADVVDLSYSYGNDFAFATITDFNPNEDTIDLDTYLNNIITGWDGSSNPFGAGFMRLVQDGSDTVLEVDRNGGGDNYERMIVFEGKTVAQFSDQNFLIDVATSQGYEPDGSGVNGSVISGTALGESLTGTFGDDTITGGDGNDTIEGANGADSLDGGNGDDQIAGGFGGDTMTGGSGADTFVFNPGEGADVITDFELNTFGEALVLQGGLTIASRTEVDTDGVGGIDSTLVTFNDGSLVLLENLLGVANDSELL